MHLGLGDHDLIFTVRSNILSRLKPRLITYRNMKNLKEADFLNNLKNALWQSAYAFDNYNDM